MPDAQGDAVDVHEAQHDVEARLAVGRQPVGALQIVVRRVDDDREVYAGPISQIEGSAWVQDVELASGRFEFVARDGRGGEARAAHNLYTSRPGRRIELTIPTIGNAK